MPGLGFKPADSSARSASCRGAVRVRRHGAAHGWGRSLVLKNPQITWISDAIGWLEEWRMRSRTCYDFARSANSWIAIIDRVLALENRRFRGGIGNYSTNFGTERTEEMRVQQGICTPAGAAPVAELPRSSSIRASAPSRAGAEPLEDCRADGISLCRPDRSPFEFDSPQPLKNTAPALTVGQWRGAAATPGATWSPQSTLCHQSLGTASRCSGRTRAGSRL